MKNYLLAFMILIMSLPVWAQTDNSICLADPTIFYDNGTYYLYGTGGIPNHGFLVYTSTDLKNWSEPAGVHDGYALIKGETFGTKGFWAPQVFTYRGKYYMAYTADEFIAIASADNPLGPFKQEKIHRLPTEIRQIDPFVFFDNDGKIYLYHVRLTEGNRLFVAELNDGLTDIIPGTLKECITAVDHWEDTQKVEWPVVEGPTIIKVNGLYYFFYSANDFRNIDYAVGYAVSDSPYGPWKKYEGNPIIDRHLLGDNGTGHGDLFWDKDNNMWYVFHIHNTNEKVSPRRTALIRIDEISEENTIRFEADKNTYTTLEVK